jgi:hypothetical protein
MKTPTKTTALTFVGQPFLINTMIEYFLYPFAPFLAGRLTSVPPAGVVACSPFPARPTPPFAPSFVFGGAAKEKKMNNHIQLIGT